MTKINDELLPLARPIKWFKSDPKNARRHAERSISAIASSLREFGQQKPVVAVSDGTVIAGNGTLAAAMSIGWDALAAVVFEDEQKARAFAIADNKTTELSEWDWSVLADEIRAITDVGLIKATGFDDRELESILANTKWNGDPSQEKPPPSPDAAYKVQKFFRVRVMGEEAIKLVHAELEDLAMRHGSGVVEIIE